MIYFVIARPAATSFVWILRNQEAASGRGARSWFAPSVLRRKRQSDNPNNYLRGIRLNIERGVPPSENRRPSLTEGMGPAVVASAPGRGNGASAPAADVVDIEEIHREAILQKQSTYVDPATGFMVFTELPHLKRGKCCGNRCRHCPYGWENVRSNAGGIDNAGKKKAGAISGDREGTNRLVRRILSGTYYENEHSSEEARRAGVPNNDTNRGRKSSAIDAVELRNDAQSHPKPVAAKGRRTGGRAGGKFTSKNVPYTRGGDAGTSQLFTGERRGKDDLLFEALGTVDELCSVVGVVYAELNAPRRGNRCSHAATSDEEIEKVDLSKYGVLAEQILEVMSRLFDVGSHIASPTPPNGQRRNGSASALNETNKHNCFHSHHAMMLEEWIDKMTDELPELTSFILPTGSPASAQLHLARTVCRRAERRMVPLATAGTIDPKALAYVNRLSDYFFTAARYVNYCDDRDEVKYMRESSANYQRKRVVVKLKK